MAYNYDKDEQTVVALLDKNDRGDKIQIQSIRNKNTGSKSVDIRLMYTPADGCEVRPTQKGVRFSNDMLADIVVHLVSMMDEFDMQRVKAYVDSKLSDS